MKSITTYIKEALNSDIQNWLNDVYETNKTLIKNNKVTPIEIDVNKLNKPSKPFDYDQFINDPIFKKTIGDNLVGFTVTNQIISNLNKYLIDKNNNKELKPNCYPYWYSIPIDKNTQNTFFVGLCLYDRNITYLNNYLHLISIESSLFVKNSINLNKAILNDFSKVVKKVNSKYEGISANPIHPKMKAILIKLGFTPSHDNKDIFIYKI